MLKKAASGVLWLRADMVWPVVVLTYFLYAPRAKSPAALLAGIFNSPNRKGIF